MLTTEQGARTTIHCATTGDLVDGGYHDDGKLKRPSRPAEDDNLAKELWRKREEWTR